MLTAVAVALGVPETAGAALKFRDCDGSECASLSVPLDYSGAVPGRLELDVHRDSLRAPEGVTLVVPGAPGAPGGSTFPWEELMPNQSIVVFDPRGTGRGSLRCRDLEAATVTDAGREAAACATLVGERRQFYRAADTVEDMELLRAALGAERLTLVGSAYGSYVAQRYALRYPQRVERMILTSPDDAAGLDPLFRDSAAATPRVLSDLCRNACGRFTRDPAGDTRRLVAQLAEWPLRGSIVGPRGGRRAASLSRQELLFTLLMSDANPISRADYPAAVVSGLRGDPAPLLRLKRRGTKFFDVVYPRLVSAATAAAATCEETRFPWAWHASPAERAEAAYRAETELAPALANPFDPGTLVRSERMRLCSRWPTASPGPPPEPGPMPDVPVLLLAHSTTISTPVETAMRTAARFPRSKLLVSSELAELGECGERAVRRFISGRAVQDRCPRDAPLIRPTAPLPTSLADLAPVRGVPGRRGRLVRAFAATVGGLFDDLFASLFSDPEAALDDGAFRGGGLRGGSFLAAEDLLSLRRYEFVPGVRISGVWSGGVEPSSQGPLRIDGPGRLDGVVRLGEVGQDLFVRVRGRIAGRRFRVRVRVPSRLVELIVEEGGLAAAAALPWRLRCAVPQLSPSPAWPPASSSPRRRARRCASSAVATPASAARG